MAICYNTSTTFGQAAIYNLPAYWFGYIPQPWRNQGEKTLGIFIVDYRREDGRFPVSENWLTISNPDSLSNSDTGINSGMRSCNSAYLNSKSDVYDV